MALSKKVHPALDLAFPAAEFATQVTASLGMRGSGKTNGAAVIAEDLLEAGVQVVVLDYVGIWFSLRLQEDGKTASPYQIPVLGGRHGDITLVATSGAVVAEALARTGSPAVLDISLFSKNDRCRFATDFAEAFFRAKQEHPGAVQLLLEEAQRFVPQKFFTGQERMLGAFEEIAEVGRNFGIGLHLISQRPQKINKDVLNLADNVFAYRTNGVLERKAIGEWVQEKGAEGRKDVHDELPGLERGTAIVWSPVRQLYSRYAIRKRTTYDAGATPIHARAAVKTKPLDLASLEAVMGKAVEEAKANDPRVLKGRIAELEKQLLKEYKSVHPAAKPEPLVSDDDWKRIERLVEKLDGGETVFLTRAREIFDRLAQAQQSVVSELGNLNTALKRGSVQTVRLYERTPAQVKKAIMAGIDASLPPGDFQLSKCARAILGVLAQRDVANDSQISALSGYRKTSSGFTNALSELRTKALIEGPKERREITQAGRLLAGKAPELPMGEELLRYWTSRLGKCERALLEKIFEAGTITRADLSDQTGYSMTSSGFTNALSQLRVLDLIYGQQGGDVSIAEVFQE